MTSSSGRRGHAAIGAIIRDMEPYLPPDSIDRPGYKHCRTTYGLLTTTYKRAEVSETPEKVYRELQALEVDLRRRLNSLVALKGIPAAMTHLLEELKSALEQAMVDGVDTDFLLKGIVDQLKKTPDSQPAPKPHRVRMVPESMHLKAKAELKAQLAEANKKIERLNDENNRLSLRIRKLEYEQRRHWG